jgi:hypothetical protein
LPGHQAVLPSQFHLKNQALLAEKYHPVVARFVELWICADEIIMIQAKRGVADAVQRG